MDAREAVKALKMSFLSNDNNIRVENTLNRINECIAKDFSPSNQIIDGHPGNTIDFKNYLTSAAEAIMASNKAVQEVGR